MEHNLENLDVYILAEEYGDLIWNEVEVWFFFHKGTIGKQLVTSSDSISANIAEGYGRYYYKDRLQFLYYARGSLKESQSWTRKAHRRKIISEESFTVISTKSEVVHSKLNGYIKFIKQQIKNSGKK